MGIKDAGHVIPGAWAECDRWGSLDFIPTAEGTIRRDDETQLVIGAEVKAVGAVIAPILVLGGQDLPALQGLGVHPADYGQAASDVQAVLGGVANGQVLVVIALQVGG